MKRAAPRVSFVCMPSITISISDEAHRRLKKMKTPGESFSNVILRNYPEVCLTGGEILASLRRDYHPAAMKKGREKRNAA